MGSARRSPAGPRDGRVLRHGDRRWRASSGPAGRSGASTDAPGS